MGSDAGQFLTTLLNVIAFFGVVLVVRVLFAAREEVARRLRRAVRGLVVLLVAFFALAQVMYHPGDAFLTAWIIAVGVVLMTPKRSRYIPVKERRKAIARFEAETGEKYNPNKHHVDHLWPFARGGSHTADNLRVISKQENLRKGKRRPKLRELNVSAA